MGLGGGNSNGFLDYDGRKGAQSAMDDFDLISGRRGGGGGEGALNAVKVASRPLVLRKWKFLTCWSLAFASVWRIPSV